VKRLIYVLSFFAVLSGAGADDVFKFHWNFGSIGLGVNYSSNVYDNLELTFSVVNFVFEHDYSGFGFEFNPVKYRHLEFFNEEQEENSIKGSLSFLNINAYLDLIGNRAIILGPFASLNYIVINASTGLNMDEYVFSSGLRFSLRLNNGYILNAFSKYNLQMDVEVGYRNIMRDNKFYVSVTGDLIGLLYLFASTTYHPLLKSQ